MDTLYSLIAFGLVCLVGIAAMYLIAKIPE
jgi:hypothetical protein